MCAGVQLLKLWDLKGADRDHLGQSASLTQRFLRVSGEHYDKSLRHRGRWLALLPMRPCNATGTRKSAAKQSRNLKVLWSLSDRRAARSRSPHVVQRPKQRI